METLKVFVIIGLLFYLVTCLVFLDIARKDFGTLAKKVMWVAIAMIPFIGCVIYLVFGFRKGRKPAPE